jgi:hypothetical protein
MSPTAGSSPEHLVASGTAAKHLISPFLDGPEVNAYHALCMATYQCTRNTMISRRFDSLGDRRSYKQCCSRFFTQICHTERASLSCSMGSAQGMLLIIITSLFPHVRI